MRQYFFWILLFFFYNCTCLLHAQTPVVRINDILIVGNKKTKPRTVLGYLNFTIGDSLNLEDLMPLLKENERLVLNSRLFIKATLNIAKWNDKNIDLKLEVEESWYIFPLPVIELADRNFNVWWRDFNCDIRRVNLGLWTYWRNLNGYNDRMQLILQWGYIRKFELDYQLPPLFKQSPFGFGFNLLYSDNKESAYTIKNHTLQFYQKLDSKDRQYKRLRFSIAGNFRPTIHDQHQLKLSYKDLRIGDSLVILNPDFFLNAHQRQQSVNLEYEYKRDKRDIISYPLRGYFIQLHLLKRGLGIFKDINQLWATAYFSHYLPVKKRWSISHTLGLRYSFIRKKQPFWQQEAIGYGQNYIRGFQYYVVNGQNYIFSRHDINLKLLDYKIPLFKHSSSAFLQTLPIKVHFRYHFDYGYVQDSYYQNQGILVNQHLWGTGLGVDLAFHDYNLVTQFEYTLNKLGEKDVYLRLKIDF